MNKLLLASLTMFSLAQLSDNSLLYGMSVPSQDTKPVQSTSSSSSTETDEAMALRLQAEEYAQSPTPIAALKTASKKLPAPKKSGYKKAAPKKGSVKFVVNGKNVILSKGGLTFDFGDRLVLSGSRIVFGNGGISVDGNQVADTKEKKDDKKTDDKK